VLRSLARRVLELNAEANEHKRTITSVVQSLRPDLLTLPGVGPIIAATVLCAWSHRGRCRSEAAFAKLGGVAPIEASTGPDRPSPSQSLRRLPAQSWITHHRLDPAAM
jgi:transposase